MLGLLSFFSGITVFILAHILNKKGDIYTERFCNLLSAGVITILAGVFMMAFALLLLV